MKINIDPTLPTHLKAKLEFSPAPDLFRIALDHRTVYLTLQSKASEELRPIVDWYVENGRFDCAIKFIQENYPDCSSKHITLKHVFDKHQEFSEIKVERHE